MKITEHHQVMGEWAKEIVYDRGFYWSAESGAVDLGTLGGPYTLPVDINELGQIVGDADTEPHVNHAFLWEDGAIKDLNDLILPNSGWTLYGATDINNLGQIVGYGDLNGVRHSFLLTPTASAPVATSVAPGTGATAGGTSVFISGAGFTGATAVFFGGTAATSFTVDSDTKIEAVSPAHAAGTVDVTVTTPGGKSQTSSADQFTYSDVVFRLPWVGGSTWGYNTGPHDGETALDFQPLGWARCAPPIDPDDWVYPVAAGTVIKAVKPNPTYVVSEGVNAPLTSAQLNAPVSLYIRHANGYVSFYTHLANSTIKVEWNPDGSVKKIENPNVQVNMPLGNPSCFYEPGNPAFAPTGVHLHFALTNTYDTPGHQWSEVLYQTPLCGWALSEDNVYHPLMKAGEPDAYPMTYSPSGTYGDWESPPNEQRGLISNDDCPIPNAPTPVLDKTQPMQTGDHVSGGFTIDYFPLVLPVLQILIGPFFSDVDLVVTRPDGSVVNPTDPGVHLVKSDNSISMTIDNAPAGHWTYEVIANELDPGGENVRIAIDEFDGSPPDTSDTTLPVISGSLSPTPNGAGWNNTNVDIDWQFADPESGIRTTAGCSDVTLEDETSGTSVTCGVIDGAGLSTAETVVARIDKTPPTVSYSGNRGTYTVDQTVSITCSASDALSQVASTTCKDITGPAYSFALGSNTSSATATDNAGNVGQGSVQFTVGATADSLCSLTKQFARNARAAARLCAPLAGLRLAATTHNQRMKSAFISAYILLVRTQGRSTLTSQQAATLIQLARSL
jgi:probable HAF family extracellular repeat protein